MVVGDEIRHGGESEKWVKDHGKGWGTFKNRLEEAEERKKMKKEKEKENLKNNVENMYLIYNNLIFKEHI